MTRYEIDRAIDEIARLPKSERESRGYNCTGKLYYAFKNAGASSNDASDLLYTLAYMSIKLSGEDYFSDAVYDFLAECFGVNLSKSAFIDSLNRHSTPRDIEYCNQLLKRFSDDDCFALVIFVTLIYVSDGRITQGERNFIYGFYE